MSTRKQKTCLVLSGGGAKGVYHIGAWRALGELGIEVDGFVGSSIGAIIAAFLAQGADSVLEEIGRTMAMDSILALPPELVQNGELKVDSGVLAKVRSILGAVMEKQGLDTSPLRRTLVEKLHEDRIRASGHDLGIVTVSLSDLQPRELFLEDMEPGLLVDYLMASAAFPGFERTEVAGKPYLDGGMYDNVPYSMARARGYTTIIVIDISGLGRTRKMSIEGTSTTYIRSSIPMGGVLDFDKQFLADYMELGYLDTLRTYGELHGYRYFLRDSEESLGADFRGALVALPRPAWPDYLRYDPRQGLRYLECMATILDIPRIRAYTYGELYGAIREKAAKDRKKLEEFLQSVPGKKVGLIARFAKAIESRQLEGSPWFYHQVLEALLPGAAGDMLQGALLHLVPELAAGLAGLGALSSVDPP